MFSRAELQYSRMSYLFMDLFAGSRTSLIVYKYAHLHSILIQKIIGTNKELNIYDLRTRFASGQREAGGSASSDTDCETSSSSSIMF